ncbi:hypothetical protein C0Q70_13696 [Pomacea canaliculata]|uniref:ABC transporter domain-containing protein n=2 Tax=Pomacea canaliculata TaxID=400727 RepID=A0A2T7NXX1_POMCA|nr:hypothetical protein C0Q70_13696 [Pomacea canaliculata]
MHLRVNAESAAFYHAAAIEEDKTNTKLHDLLATQKKLIRWEFVLKFCISSADYLGSILSYIAIAFPIFYGHYDDLPPADMSSLISKNAFVSIYLINCFTTLMDQASSVTDVAGTAHRIGQLFEVLATLTEDQKEHRNSLCRPYSESFQEGSNSVREMTTRYAFEMEGVTYGPPKSSIVCCRGLTLQLKPNSNILVTGDSGCGKTSLIRIISGLWRSYQGSVNLGAGRIPQEIMYLPQKPYLTNGSLWDQIVFPSSETEVIPDDYKIYQYLSAVGLDPLVERIGGLDKDMDWNWHDELSPGEMQRLSFVRLFFHHPPFAILDEATSQVSEDMETILYQTCADLHITLLSVGHRNSIRRFHDFVLHISNDGGWTFQPLSNDHDGSRPDGGGGGEGSQSGHREQRDGAKGGRRAV